MSNSIVRHAAQIARALLGKRNEALSTEAQWRFGTNGSLAVEVAGDKQGTWYDFECETGGGMVALICRERGCDKAGAYAWLKSDLGIEVSRGNGAAGKPQQRRRVAAYVYRDESGQPLFAVSRWDPKNFTQHAYDSAIGTFATGRGNMDGVRLVPYRLNEWIDRDGPVLIPEGEHKADALFDLGFLATCNPGGAGNFNPGFAPYFQDRDVLLLPDNDAAGRDHVRKVAEILRPVAASIRLLELPGLPTKGDIINWLAAGSAAEQLRALVGSAPLYTPSSTGATAQPHPDPDPAAASKLLQRRDILAAFRRAVRLRGLVGEVAVAQLLYLAITSRLLTRPVSVGVKGHSSSGKSHTVDRVLEFFPDDAVIKFTAMSERALIYDPRDYAHRTIVIYEVTGLRETNEDNQTSYFIRTLLSEGRLEYSVTIRDAGGQYTTQRMIKEGPTNLIFTTTKTRVHAENETRVLSLNTDDGTEQTRQVLLAMAGDRERRVDLGEWQRLQSWLQGAERRVVIPYGRELAAAVPPLAVRLRRDFGAVLALIRAHAILHQLTRERDGSGRIVATLEDYVAVRALVLGVISEGIGAGVSKAVRETVEAVRVLSAGGSSVTANEIASYLEIDKSNATRRVRRAADGGYIRNLEDKRGRPGRWVAGDPLPDEAAVLPEPAVVARNPQPGCNRARNGQDVENANESAGGCAVAHAQEGICDHCHEPVEPGVYGTTATSCGKLLHNTCVGEWARS